MYLPACVPAMSSRCTNGRMPFSVRPEQMVINICCCAAFCSAETVLSPIDSPLSSNVSSRSSAIIFTGSFSVGSLVILIVQVCDTSSCEDGLRQNQAVCVSTQRSRSSFLQTTALRCCSRMQEYACRYGRGTSGHGLRQEHIRQSR